MWTGSGKNQNLYVSPFTGFVVIGTLEGFNFPKNSLAISVDNLNQNKEPEISCRRDYLKLVKMSPEVGIRNPGSIEMHNILLCPP